MQRQVEEARQARTGALKRNIIRIVVGSIAAIGAVLLIAWIGGAFDGDDTELVQTTPPVDQTVPDVTSDTTPTTVADAPAVASEKPDVELPAEIPTELEITTLIEGEGDGANNGDTVEVQYVGVRSVDGVEFDSNFDSGGTFPVVLGQGRVIQGWDQGLIGAKAGDRIQLDIPANLAYGDAARSEVIRENEALTFVIDVVSVTPPPPPVVPEQADPSLCPATDGSEVQQQSFDAAPPFCIDVEKTYTAEIITNVGAITAELFPKKAPVTVNSFVTLARFHYFDETECHRIIPGFVAQCGSPDGTGNGGPGYQIPDELPVPGEYVIGSLAMANAGPNTSGSQFFLITGPQGEALPPAYSLFGEVIGGLDTTLPELDALGNPANNGVPPLSEVIVRSVTITES